MVRFHLWFSPQVRVVSRVLDQEMMCALNEKTQDPMRNTKWNGNDEFPRRVPSRCCAILRACGNKSTSPWQNMHTMWATISLLEQIAGDHGHALGSGSVNSVTDCSRRQPWWDPWNSTSQPFRLVDPNWTSIDQLSPQWMCSQQSKSTDWTFHWDSTGGQVIVIIVIPRQQQITGQVIRHCELVNFSMLTKWVNDSNREQLPKDSKCTAYDKRQLRQSLLH